MDWTNGPPPGAAIFWLLVAALAGGLARGFSGFGAALIFIPLAGLAVGPQRAPPLMLLLEVLALVALTPNAWREGNRREVGWLALGLALGTPLGAMALVAADPLLLRWGVSLLVLALLGLVVSGWRLDAQPAPPVTIGFGVAGGVLGGLAMLSGPPAMAYMLGRGEPAKLVRANFSLYFAAGALLAGIAYAVAGLFDGGLALPFLLTAPGYGIGIWIGSRMFGLASERVFRRVCYAMIALAALISLPAWDGLLR